MSNQPEMKNLRFIVFLIDSKFKEHDGKLFSSLREAKEFVVECMAENYCDKAVIGTVYIDLNSKEMLISKVETFGFTGDRKNIDQLQLF
jgi:hypothetical protein